MRQLEYKEIVYKSAEEVVEMNESNSSIPFGSKNSKTYTFSWCQGSHKIAKKNKVYFSSPLEAEALGKKLSKLCQK